MRTIFLLRGAPSSGKSTWVQENNLMNYCISVDTVRELFQSPIILDDGNYAINLVNDNAVWDLLLKILEKRMRRGEFIIIDATHYKSTLLNAYKKLIDRYRYRAFVVDFTDISLEENLRRNSLRPSLKRVPDETIRKQHALFCLDDKEVSNKFKIISRDEAAKIAHSKGDDLLFKYDKFKKIFIFGDIHGCFDPLDKFFKENPFNEEYAYIFTGDYLDRGIQNKETLSLLLSLSKNRNVLFLEGNHEIWLRLYAQNKGAEDKIDPDLAKELNEIDKTIVKELMEDKIRSNGFIKKTIPQIQDFDKSDLRQFCRKLAQMAFIEFKGKKYVITHGGIPCEPRMIIPTDQIIKGTGGYENLDETYDTFVKNLPEEYIMVHGHRNVLGIDAEQRNGRVYNLCSDVEIGADLRVLELSDDGSRKVKLYSNEVYDPASKDNKFKKYSDDVLKTDDELVAGLYASNQIIKKELDGGFTSFNFSRSAFRDHNWNKLTVKARGLFLDNTTKKIVVRSYDKFFNWNETDNNTPAVLNKTLSFPVVAYQKENGFLALISYNEKQDGLLVCSKSTNVGDSVNMIKDCLAQYDSEVIYNLKNFLKNNNVTLIFECIHPNDRHIIDYSGVNNLVLLDIVENSFETKLWDYEKVCTVANTFGFDVKKKSFVFNNFIELFNFVKNQDKDNAFNTRLEGWVFVDQNNYMVKYKTRFYRFWKAKRTMLEAFQKGRIIDKTFAFEEDIKVYNFIKSLHDYDSKFNDYDIIDIERQYYHKPEFISESK